MRRPVHHAAALLANPRFAAGDLAYLDQFVAWWTEACRDWTFCTSASAAPYASRPGQLAPEGAGLVVVDADTMRVHHMQGLPDQPTLGAWTVVGYPSDAAGAIAFRQACRDALGVSAEEEAAWEMWIANKQESEWTGGRRTSGT